MQTLEEQVRNAVVRRRVTTIVARFQEEKYQQMYHRMFAEIAEEVQRRFVGTEHGKTRLTDNELKEFTAPLLTPQKIREAIEIVAKDSYTSSRELEKELSDIDPKIYAVIRPKVQGLRTNVHSITMILTELKKIAEKKGVEYAATQDAEDRAVLAVFPTEQAYRNFVNHSYHIREEVSGVIKELEIQRKARELPSRIDAQMRLYLATITCLTVRQL